MPRGEGDTQSDAEEFRKGGCWTGKGMGWFMREILFQELSSRLGLWGSVLDWEDVWVRRLISKAKRVRDFPGRGNPDRSATRVFQLRPPWSLISGLWETSFKKHSSSPPQFFPLSLFLAVIHMSVQNRTLVKRQGGLSMKNRVYL